MPKVKKPQDKPFAQLGLFNKRQSPKPSELPVATWSQPSKDDEMDYGGEEEEKDEDTNIKK